MAENRQMRSVALVLATLFITVVVITALVFSLSSNGNAPSDAESVGGDFTLQSAHGPVSLSQFRGQAVLLFFGYTHCPDVCPTTMSSVAEAMSLLSSEEQSKVQPLFITVDPERDTGSHLAEYLSFFHPKIIGLSDTIEETKKVAARYSVEFFREGEDEKGDNYLVSHTSYLFLINPNGEIVDLMSDHTTPADIAKTLRLQIPSPTNIE